MVHTVRRQILGLESTPWLPNMYPNNSWIRVFGASAVLNFCTVHPRAVRHMIANIRSPARLTAYGRLRDEPPFSNSVAQHALTRIRRNDAWTCCRASATFESHHQPADALAFISWGQQIESCCAHGSRELAVDRSMFRCETELNHKRHHSYVAAPAPE